MKVGQIVSFNDSFKWVLVFRNTKKISGVVKEKVFYRLPPKKDYAHAERKFTHALEAKAKPESSLVLTDFEKEAYNALMFENWVVWSN